MSEQHYAAVCALLRQIQSRFIMRHAPMCNWCLALKKCMKRNGGFHMLLGPCPCRRQRARQWRKWRWNFAALFRSRSAMDCMPPLQRWLPEISPPLCSAPPQLRRRASRSTSKRPLRSLAKGMAGGTRSFSLELRVKILHACVDVSGPEHQVVERNGSCSVA